MNSAPDKPRRRWWRWLTAALLLSLAIPVGGLFWLSRPRPDLFLARVTSLVAVEVEPAQPEAGGHVSQAVQVRGQNGLAVNLRVLRPAEAERPLPLVVLLAGHRTGRDAVGLLGSPGPFVVAALDYPYDGPERPRGLQQSLATISAARVGLRDTPSAVLLALDWLAAQPWVDAQCAELAGVSLGVPFAVVSGALDRRFRRVWLIHGGADKLAWIEHNLQSRIGSDALRRIAARLVWLLAHGPSLDSRHWLPLIAPRPVVIIGARADRRLPPELVERLHAAAVEPKELLWMDGDHVDRQPGAVRHLLELMRGRMLENRAGGGASAL